MAILDEDSDFEAVDVVYVKPKTDFITDEQETTPEWGSVWTSSRLYEIQVNSENVASEEDILLSELRNM